jgi:hypothetical protein
VSDTVEVNVGALFKGIGRAIFCRRETVMEGKEKVTRYRFSLKKLFTAVMAIWAVTGFSLFIIEEAGQMVMFSTFPLQDVGQYDMIRERADTMRSLSGLGRAVNAAIGWTNPLMLIAYNQTWMAQDMYADSLEVLCAVNGGVAAQVDVKIPTSSAPKTSTTSVVTPDFGPLGSVIIGPPDFTAPPVVPGAIVLDRADAMTEIAKWAGWGKTIIFPCTSIQVAEKIVRAKSPFGFEAIAFTKTGGPACEALKLVGNSWVAVQGEIEFYQQGGTYEIILNGPDDIQGTWPLTSAAGS